MNIKHRFLRTAVRKLLRFLPAKLYVKAVYFLTFKRRLNLGHPVLWTEKLQWKKLYDRRPLLTLAADKYRVRKYVEEKVGDNILTKLLWVGENPKEIPFDALPESFVIKTNHGGAMNILVEDKSQVNVPDCIAVLQKWLRKSFYWPEKEWAYRNIKRLVFVEELLCNETGQVPSDIKFYMIHGEVWMIDVHVDRFGNHKVFRLNGDFEPFDSTMGTGSAISCKLERPKHFIEMIEYAKKLSADFDFIRVDFYDLPERVVFGELTNYPTAGFKRLSYNLDKYLGEKWKLPNTCFSTPRNE